MGKEWNFLLTNVFPLLSVSLIPVLKVVPLELCCEVPRRGTCPSWETEGLAAAPDMWNLPFCFLQMSYLFFFARFLSGSVSKESAYNTGDPGLIPGSGRSPGDRNGNPLQYSCLGNPMNRGPWQAPRGHRESDTHWQADCLPLSHQASPSV